MQWPGFSNGALCVLLEASSHQLVSGVPQWQFMTESGLPDMQLPQHHWYKARAHICIKSIYRFQ